MNARASRLALIASISILIALAAATLAQEGSAKPRKVTKTDAEWRKLLTPEQYAVTRHADTEPAGSGKLLHNKAKGIYECVCCGTALFSSKTKFESGTGWPSFYQAYNKENVETSTDFKLGYARTEVICNICGAHLGHVFDDGPPPTGLRFCMNSAALKFAKETPAPAAAKEKPRPTRRRLTRRPPTPRRTRPNRTRPSRPRRSRPPRPSDRWMGRRRGRREPR